MNRPCTALSILLASLAGTMLAVGSANCQTCPKAGPDSFGRCHVCPLAEEYDYDCLYGACENGDNNGDVAEDLDTERYLDEYDYSYECGELPNDDFVQDDNVAEEVAEDVVESTPNTNETSSNDEDASDLDCSDYDYSDYDYSDYDYNDNYGDDGYNSDSGSESSDLDAGTGSYADDYESYNYDYENNDYQYGYDYGYNDPMPAAGTVESADSSIDEVTEETPPAPEYSDFDYGLDGEYEYDYRSGYDDSYDAEVYGNPTDETIGELADPFRDLYSGLNDCEKGIAAEPIADDYWINAYNVDDSRDVAAQDDYWQHANTIDYTAQTGDSDDYWTAASNGSVTAVDSSGDQIWDDCERWYDEEDYYYDHYEWQEHREPSTVEAPPAPASDEHPALSLDWPRPMLLLVARTLDRVGVALQEASQDLAEMAGADVAEVSRPLNAASQR